jgi:TetR/AcrR family transcriptional regulator, repressor of fatR-cypB operon
MSNRTEGRRDAIIKAVMELTAERGFHRSPKALISKKAGVGTGTIYRYSTFGVKVKR